MSPHSAVVCSAFKHFPWSFLTDNCFFPVKSRWAMANLYHFCEMMLYQLPHQSWSQLQSCAVNGLDLFVCQNIVSARQPHPYQHDWLTRMPLSPGTCTCVNSDLLVISLAFLVEFLFQTHATILLLGMLLFSANLRESLWAKEHSYYFCNYWHQVIT